jgi:hypothetical protein
MVSKCRLTPIRSCRFEGGYARPTLPLTALVPKVGCSVLVHDYRAARDDVYVEQPDAPKLGWVDGLPGGEPSHISLARVVDADAGPDEAENSYYESAADPRAVRIETSRRRFRGQYLRRLRRLSRADRDAPEH